MPVEFRCPTCQKLLKTKEEFAGRKVRCPGCQGVVAVPKPPAPASPPVRKSADQLPVAEKVSLPVPPKPQPASLPSLDDADIDSLLSFETSPPPKPNPASSSPLGAGLESSPAPVTGQGKVPGQANRVPGGVSLGGKVVAPRKDRLNAFSLVFLLMMLPLVLMTFRSDDKIEARLKKAFEKQAADMAEKQQAGKPNLPGAPVTLPEDSGGDDIENEAQMGLRALLQTLPGKKLDDQALLPVDSMQHWLFALLSGLVFFATLWGMSTGSATSPVRLILSGVLTGTVGIVMLLIIQVIAIHFAYSWRIGFSIVTLVFYILKFIGFSYICALDPTSPFYVSFFGFTFGVGLCEELCKALPVAAYLGRSGKLLTWKGALLVGLASGVGFGISEGISYSSSHYNGIVDGLVYWVRFCSCVSLHAVWCGSVALMMYPDKSSLLNFEEFSDYLNFVFRYMLVSMVLHGLYDTLLTHELNAVAMLVAIASFGWLFLMIKVRRGDVKFAT